MNDKDKEAFNKYICSHDQGILQHSDDTDIDVAERAWQAALEYKQKEIDELKDQIDHQDSLIFELDQNVQVFMEKSKALQAENERLKEAISYLPKVPTKLYEKELAQRIQRLDAENNKLKSVVMLAARASCYTEYEDACSLSRKCVEELEQ